MLKRIQEKPAGLAQIMTKMLAAKPTSYEWGDDTDEGIECLLYSRVRAMGNAVWAAAYTQELVKVYVATIGETPDSVVHLLAITDSVLALHGPRAIAAVAGALESNSPALSAVSGYRAQ